jgi:hypothetical protein
MSSAAATREMHSRKATEQKAVRRMKFMVLEREVSSRNDVKKCFALDGRARREPGVGRRIGFRSRALPGITIASR